MNYEKIDSKKTNPRFIFITGGVASSIGKGLTTASIGAILQSRGFKIRLKKLDPYLNVDPGTMSPIQHGEVYITPDGVEVDLDLGHYERFTGIAAKASDNITTGKIYSTILSNERAGRYLGSTVQVIPHVTDIIKQFVLHDSEEVDFMICEIGGTIGDIELQPFCEAVRHMYYKLSSQRVMFVHVTLVPHIGAVNELKTKPTQHSVKELRSVGIQPDMILCRSEIDIPQTKLKKIANFCNVQEQCVISIPNLDSIYEAPIKYHEALVDQCILEHFQLQSCPQANLEKWYNIASVLNSLTQEIEIGIVGKYVELTDAYKSLIEALHHGGMSNKVKIKLKWIDARSDISEQDLKVDGLVIPGGFGSTGVDSKIAAIRFARENNIPILGICMGMQLMVIEFARNACGMHDAHSTEFSNETKYPIVSLVTEWNNSDIMHTRNETSDLGGTMRLGAYTCILEDHSRIKAIYNCSTISERHRHRYEVNSSMLFTLENHGMRFSGFSEDGQLPEILEITDHPWCFGVQFHPELQSKPLEPHPLFVSFVEAALE